MAGVISEKKYTEFVRIYNGLLNGGMKTAAAYESLQNMGYDRSLSILNRHRRTVAAHGHALVVVKSAGGKRSLNEDQYEEMHEWVLDQNCQNLPFGLMDFEKQIFALYSITVCLMTA